MPVGLVGKVAPGLRVGEAGNTGFAAGKWRISASPGPRLSAILIATAGAPSSYGASTKRTSLVFTSECHDMIAVRRLLFLGAVLAATSTTATTALLGDGSKPVNTTFANPAALGKLTERFAGAKFLAPHAVHVYQTAAGETY